MCGQRLYHNCYKYCLHILPFVTVVVEPLSAHIVPFYDYNIFKNFNNFELCFTDLRNVYFFLNMF
jgi:hypothetical protein